MGNGKFDSTKIEANIVMKCASCENNIERKVPIFIQGTKEEEILDSIYNYSIFATKCPHCGCIRAGVWQFIYYEVSDNVIYYVIPDEKLLFWGDIKISLEKVLLDYIFTSDIQTRKNIKNAKKFFVPMKSFETVIKNKKEYKVGTVHFTPQPTIKINQDYEYTSEYINFGIDKNSMLLVDNNLPENFEQLIADVYTCIRNVGYPISLNKCQIENEILTTHGIPEIVIILGTYLLLPIVTSIMASVIYDFIKKKKFNEDEKEIWRFVIKINETDKQYIFAGNLEEIIESLKLIATDINSLNIGGKCHMATTAGDVIMDLYASKKPIAFDDCTEIYNKKFNKNTAVGFYLYEETQKYICDSGKICAYVETLIKNNYFDMAIELLTPYVNVEPPLTPSIEVLYNYAICLKHLKRDNEATKVFELIIRQYLELPNINDMRYIKNGNTTKEDIEESVKSTEEKIKEYEAKNGKIEAPNPMVGVALLEKMEELEKQNLLKIAKRRNALNKIKKIFKRK